MELRAPALPEYSLLLPVFTSVAILSAAAIAVDDEIAVDDDMVENSHVNEDMLRMVDVVVVNDRGDFQSDSTR